MKKIVISADSYKGTLTAKEVCEIIGSAAKSAFGSAEIVEIPIADGGEGTLEVFSEISGFKYVTGVFTDLNGKKISSEYLFNEEKKVAIIETAKTCGLPMSEKKDPKITTTLGMGEQIADAINRGAKEVVVSLGGSGTNDGGCGMLYSLGAKFFDKSGVEFIPTGGTLCDICGIDLSALDAYKDVSFTAMCDVTNPPYGELGATYVYGRQKGATEEDLVLLDRGIKNLTELLSKARGKDYSLLSGGGAAGALGLALKGGLYAKLERGISVAIKLTGLEKALENADVLITGEGKLDKQSFMGKVIDGVSLLAKKHNVPVVAICGAVDIFDEGLLRENGIVAAFPTVNKAEPFDKIKAMSKENLKRTSQSVFSLMGAFSK